MEATDFLIECINPEMFDKTIQQLGSACLCKPNEEYLKKDGHYIMRVFGNPGFIEFAIKNQGYGKIIKKLDSLT